MVSCAAETPVVREQADTAPLDTTVPDTTPTELPVADSTEDAETTPIDTDGADSDAPDVAEVVDVPKDVPDPPDLEDAIDSVAGDVEVVEDEELTAPDADTSDADVPPEDTGPPFEPPIGTWWQADSMVTPRERAAAGAYGGVIVVAGGRDYAGATLGSVESYAIVADSWAEAPLPVPKPMPTARAAAGAGMVVDSAPGGLGGRLFIAGGLGADGATTQVLERYNPGSQNWQGPPTGFKGLSKPGCCGAGLAIGDQLWIFGGHDGDTSVLSYQPTAGIWISHSPLPTGRSHPAAVEVAGDVVVVGGASVDFPDLNAPLLDAAERFDRDTEAWTALPPLPEAVTGPAGAEHAGQVWIFGGQRSDGTASDSVWVLDLELGWAAAPSMPGPRAFHSVVTTGEGIWLLGGIGAEGVLGTVDRLSFPPPP